MNNFNGLICDMSTLPLLSTAKSRSISPENRTGEKGQGGMATEGTGAGPARDLGKGWKISPSIAVASGETLMLADIAGPGAIQSMWMAGAYHPRHCILRIYWDDQEQPSVECPIGDFFCNPWKKHFQLTSQMVCNNPGQAAFNCYWPMPFRERCRMTIENRSTQEMVWYYQINYALAPVDEDAAYFHAQFRRTNPLPYKEDFVMLDGVQGRGHYAGTYMTWGVNNNGWWGEGEIKFFIDGDGEYPTICGTGTEDYFGGCYNFDVPGIGYQEYCTPYAGMPQVIRPDGLYQAQQRFGMYRWHVPDPIRFEENLRVTIQALGWREGMRYLPLQDDISSVAFWYQTLPTAPFPALPDNDYLEII